MHFVTGGAFNGKRKWVKENYPEGEWFSAYNKDPLIMNLESPWNSTFILEGIEVWVKELLAEMTMDEGRKYLRDVIAGWYNWENVSPDRKLIIIGTDITKGIVPIDKADRNWRDLIGWFYQDIAIKCERVDVVWYGLNQTVKG